MITSVSNPRIKQLVLWQNKAKERNKDGIFIAEGIKMLMEAPKEWIKEVYITDSLAKKIAVSSIEKEQKLWQKILANQYETVSDEVMEKAADTKTPQGVLTVVKQPNYSIKEILSNPKGLYLLLEDLQDPGNLGTIVRTAEGAGVNGIIMTKTTVDIFNPKTIRSTMGSVYRVPFLYVEKLLEIFPVLKEQKITTYAAHLKGTADYNGFSYKEGTAFLIGNEGNGLKKETADMADCYIKIPMEGKVESLNAAIAAALLMYEAHNQKS